MTDSVREDVTAKAIVMGMAALVILALPPITELVR
jgi:hypothetical protein